MQKIYVVALIGFLANGHVSSMDNKIDIETWQIDPGNLEKNDNPHQREILNYNLQTNIKTNPHIDDSSTEDTVIHEKLTRPVLNNNKKISFERSIANQGSTLPLKKRIKQKLLVLRFPTKLVNEIVSGKIQKKQRATKTITKHTGYKKKTTRSNVSTTITKNITKKTKTYQNSHVPTHKMLTRSKNKASEEKKY